MVDVIGLVISHKWVDIDELECAALEDVELISKELLDKPEINECAIISTCNRVEVYVVPSNNSLRKGREALLECLEPHTEVDLEEMGRFFGGEKLLKHLLKLASGLESMVVGEDQILGQVKNSFNEGKEIESIGPVLDLAFEKAINIGKKIRNETGINDGCVSIGSVAVDLAEEVLNELDNKNALLIGAGEMATIIAECLRDKGIDDIFIANRTYERAKKLSDQVNGLAIEFDEYKDYLSDIDILMTATGAPHPIIEKEDLEINKRNDIVIIDISNPRDVKNSVDELGNVSLYDIDDLNVITEKNKEKREEEARRAEGIIRDELSNLLAQYKEKEAEDLIAELHTKAHKIRTRERDKALRKLSVDDEGKQVIEKLTRSIINKILSEPTESMKRAASNGDEEILDSTCEIFNLRRKNEDSSGN